MNVQIALACVILVACKYGGSDDDPRMGIGPEDDTDEPGVVEEAMGNGDPMPSPSAKPPTTGGGADAGKTPSTGAVDSGVSTGISSKPPSGCGPATPVVTCDPVRNSGCPPLTQCDIDTGATVPTGRCVFYQAGASGVCMATFVSETCEAQSTCIANECRKMCYCDSDCPAGQCCNDLSGPGPKGAFKLCRPC